MYYLLMQAQIVDLGQELDRRQNSYIRREEVLQAQVRCRVCVYVGVGEGQEGDRGHKLCARCAEQLHPRGGGTAGAGVLPCVYGGEGGRAHALCMTRPAAVS